MLVYIYKYFFSFQELKIIIKIQIFYCSNLIKRITHHAFPTVHWEQILKDHN